MPESRLTKGRRLLKQGDWSGARSVYEEQVAIAESAEAFEGLGTACSWLNDAEGTIRAREAAFRMHEGAGDHRSAARMAAWLAIDFTEFRGEHAVANGWLQNALRLVSTAEPCSERGFVLGVAAAMKLFAGKDLGGARTLAREAGTIATAIGSPDGALMAGAIEGLALVSEGQVHEGMRRLDESTATAFSGSCEDLYIIGSSCCCMITACEKIRDFDRAGQWCNQVKEFCRRWRIGSLFAVCRTQYSSVLLSRGEWSEAEEEMTRATEELTERRPALVPAPKVRLAELRRRQGRFAEARRLFLDVEGHPLALLGLGELAFADHDWATAADYAERFLRRMPAEGVSDKVPAYELLIKACTRGGNLEVAERALDDLSAALEKVSTEPLIAARSFGVGMLASAKGRRQEAMTAFEDALDLFERAHMPFEAIQARIELARMLKAMGRESRARAEAASALRGVAELGADSLLDEIRSVFPELEPTRHTTADTHGLSPREREILLHLAEGKDNISIADELFLSIRTVERHISNVYQKLGLSGKSARAAAVAFALKHVRDGRTG